MSTRRGRGAAGLWLLIGLFAFRVAAQLLQWLSPVDWLPSFDAWQGSGLPYWALLAAQALILLVMMTTARRIATGRLVPRQRAGRWCLALGALYFGTMAVRLTVGVLHLSSHRWFATTLPALFHLVLATFTLLVGRFHWRRGAAGATQRPTPGRRRSPACGVTRRSLSLARSADPSRDDAPSPDSYRWPRTR